MWPFRYSDKTGWKYPYLRPPRSFQIGTWNGNWLQKGSPPVTRILEPAQNKQCKRNLSCIVRLWAYCSQSIMKGLCISSYSLTEGELVEFWCANLSNFNICKIKSAKTSNVWNLASSPRSTNYNRGRYRYVARIDLNEFSGLLETKFLSILLLIIFLNLQLFCHVPIVFVIRFLYLFWNTKKISKTVSLM